MRRDPTGRFGHLLLGAALAAAMLSAGSPTVAAASGSCRPTGANDRDGTALTARVINPSGAVTGRLDSTGCDVGVYFSRGSGRVTDAEVFGARYYGVLVDGNDGHTVRVNVTGSAFHDIGDAPITSSRHGQGVAYRAFGSGTATGTVAESRFWAFQEAAINMTGPGTTVTARDNRVQGRGPIATISQNGIQVIFGGHGTVLRNRISDLMYLGPGTGNGVLVTGGGAYDWDPTKGCLPTGCDITRGARIEDNVITDADTGVVAFNADADFNPPTDRTDTIIAGNRIRKDDLTNVAGWDDSTGVQEGVFAYGNHDSITDNVIMGKGYDQDACGDAAVCMAIDTAGAIDPIVTGNVVR
jgi:hypothetical protein